mmetsp:Transcript_102326/g.257777  ORF Transcript_102326/g.257777 Transcript_102326/m.257777 type:complete len:389 (+) Transcript_102326:771-1937(+)
MQRAAGVQDEAVVEHAEAVGWQAGLPTHVAARHDAIVPPPAERAVEVQCRQARAAKNERPQWLQVGGWRRPGPVVHVAPPSVCHLAVGRPILCTDAAELMPAQCQSEIWPRSQSRDALGASVGLPAETPSLAPTVVVAVDIEGAGVHAAGPDGCRWGQVWRHRDVHVGVTATAPAMHRPGHGEEAAAVAARRHGHGVCHVGGRICVARARPRPDPLVPLEMASAFHLAAHDGADGPRADGHCRHITPCGDLTGEKLQLRYEVPAVNPLVLAHGASHGARSAAADGARRHGPRLLAARGEIGVACRAASLPLTEARLRTLDRDEAVWALQCAARGTAIAATIGVRGRRADFAVTQQRLPLCLRSATLGARPCAAGRHGPRQISHRGGRG